VADPNLSAQTAESDLRELVRLVLEPVLGAEWIERTGVFMPEQITKIKPAFSTASARRPKPL
jgi:hypothetical protein